MSANNTPPPAQATATLPAIASATLPPANATRSARVYAALQLPDSRPPPAPITMQGVDDLIAPYMPEALKNQAASNVNISVGMGNTVEQVFRSELGLVHARARAFLASWLRHRKYKIAFEMAGLQGAEIQLFKLVSPTFDAVFNSIDAFIRCHRHAESEDTLHALANGEIAEPVYGPVGGGMSGKIGEKAIYSEKALVTELAAQDPRRYGKAVGEASGLSITLNLSLPAEKQAEIIDVDSADADKEISA